MTNQPAGREPSSGGGPDARSPADRGRDPAPAAAGSAAGGASRAGRGGPFAPGPARGLQERSYQVFAFIDVLLHLGVATLLVIIAGLVFTHILLTGLNDLDVASRSTAAFFDVILNDTNSVLFVVILLEILATVISHLRDRTFTVRPFLVIGMISSVRHILIVTAHMSAESGKTEAALFNQQIVELVVNTGVTLFLVLCYWLVSRADMGATAARRDRRGSATGDARTPVAE